MEKYPTKFTHIREPYGTLHLEKCRVEKDPDNSLLSGSKKQTYTIEGIVQEGGTYSFMCGFSHFNDEKGNRHVIYNVTKKELEQGYKRDIAM
jgi:hypothetical protein